MKIQVFGPGCIRCKTTYQNVINACSELQIAADISHETDVSKFAEFGIMATPAVLINGKLVVSGKVPTVAELKKIIKS